MKRRDLTGRRVAGGRIGLFLTLLVLLSMNAAASGFTYIPPKQHGGLWDVWVLHANDTWYLFYGGAKSGYGTAASKDGVHWKECGPVAAANWRGGGSAFTWKSPNFAKDGKHQCDKRVGRAIMITESNDLLNWKVREEVYYRPDPRWYSQTKRWICI